MVRRHRRVLAGDAPHRERERERQRQRTACGPVCVVATLPAERERERKGTGRTEEGETALVGRGARGREKTIRLWRMWSVRERRYFGGEGLNL